jgi:hypothetical protein
VQGERKQGMPAAHAEIACNYVHRLRSSRGLQAIASLSGFAVLVMIAHKYRSAMNRMAAIAVLLPMAEIVLIIAAGISDGVSFCHPFSLRCLHNLVFIFTSVISSHSFLLPRRRSLQLFDMLRDSFILRPSCRTASKSPQTGV